MLDRASPWFDREKGLKMDVVKGYERSGRDRKRRTSFGRTYRIVVRCRV